MVGLNDLQTWFNQQENLSRKTSVGAYSRCCTVMQNLFAGSQPLFRNLNLPAGLSSAVEPHPTATQVVFGVATSLPLDSGKGRHVGRIQRLNRNGSSTLIIAMSFCMVFSSNAECIFTYFARLAWPVGVNDNLRSRPAWISQ